MKPVIAVAFGIDAPIQPYLKLYARLMTNPETWLLNCSEVRETNYGFLQLVPVEEAGNPLALFVPPRYVLWMLQAEQPSQLGFLAGLTQATPQSDPAA